MDNAALLYAAEACLQTDLGSTSLTKKLRRLHRLSRFSYIRGGTKILLRTRNVDSHGAGGSIVQGPPRKRKAEALEESEQPLPPIHVSKISWEVYRKEPLASLQLPKDWSYGCDSWATPLDDQAAVENRLPSSEVVLLNRKEASVEEQAINHGKSLVLCHE